MPSSPTADAVMRAEDPPWWYDHHPQFGQELGPYLARLVTGLADYVFACALRSRADARWALGKGRSMAHFQHPVLHIDGRGEIDYAIPISLARLGLRGERNVEPDALRRWLEQWLGMDPAHEAELERLCASARSIRRGSDRRLAFHAPGQLRRRHLPSAGPPDRASRGSARWRSPESRRPSTRTARSSSCELRGCRAPSSSRSSRASGSAAPMDLTRNRPRAFTEACTSRRSRR